MHNLAMSTQRGPLEMGVSAREVEVLTAVAEHLTNAEIAARLFISIRTVESHVSSLLRKFQVDDRRALATVAATMHLSANPSGMPAVATRIPSPLTPFVGRGVERAVLAEALGAHRLVTAIGPGGVGKTRLALTVVADLADRFADGAWFVDLVPVTDPSMIASTIAEALGLGEHQARSPADTIRSWLTERETLLVLDNCEHLLAGVVVLLERLLGGSPGLTVLATSRARLLVPFEWVFPVPGLSLETDDGEPGDAVALFLGRAAASGTPIAAGEWPRIEEVCRRLDGMALAIELAAARLPSLGLDGLEAGLADRLRLLTGGPRIDERHRSLRSMLDWSYALLTEPEQAVLRRVSAFADAFTVGAAAALLADWPPVPGGAIPTILAGLAEQSLLATLAEPGGTRYRALETIRQYGAELRDDAGESVEALSRHLSWCLDIGADLARAADSDARGRRVAFDQIVDELRGALSWAAGEPAFRAEAYRLAIRLAELSFDRGLPSESQRRYEQAADLAADDQAAAVALRLAAGAAESRHFGDDALRLHRAAADAALRARNHAAAASDLASAAMLINRNPGLIATRPSTDAAAVFLAEARRLAAGDPAAEARVLTAEAYLGDDLDPVTTELAERALTLAQRVRDPLTESAALDELTAIHLACGELQAALGQTLRRIELLTPLPVTAMAGLEISDAFIMATETAIAAGDFPIARDMAERSRDLPFNREEGHLATARLILVTALAGDWDETVTLARRFREGWERAGQPRAGNLSRAGYAAATVYGLQGEDDLRALWLGIVARLETPGRPLSDIHVGEFFDALLLLHRGLPELAMQQMHTPPEHFREWHNGMWRPWYAALWAEAAVLTQFGDAESRIHRARFTTRGNPIAVAIVDRAAALHRPGRDRDALLGAAAVLEAAGCRYQWARTLVMVGGEYRARGEAALAAIGATPMVWPSESG
jgi:predicted ATPase/DNA-binding CsgD family transcriptional regulator